MKTLLLLSLLSFSSFAGSHEIIGGSCWKCVGGSFTTGEIECQPERTARLFEVPMQECLDNRQAATAPLRSQVKRNYQDTSNVQKARLRSVIMATDVREGFKIRSHGNCPLRVGGEYPPKGGPLFR